MKKNTPLAELRRGDKIYVDIFVDFGMKKRIAKVINNRPDLKKINVKIYYGRILWLIPFTWNEKTFDYKSHNLENYDLYNIFK